MRKKEEDEVVDLYSARTLDHLLFFTNRGRVYSQRVFGLPETGRDGRGLPLVNFLNLTADERVTTLLVVPDFAQAEYVTMVTRLGRVKRVRVDEFADVRPSGIIATNLEPGDELAWAKATHGKQEFIIVSAGGRALRFPEDQVRPMGRTAAGVMGIRLLEGDRVASFEVVEPGGDLLCLTQHGWGKRTPLSEYPIVGRGGQGVWTTDHTRTDETGGIAAARVVQEGDEISIITAKGIALRTDVAAISQMSRMTRGVRIVNLDENDLVAAMARLTEAVEGESERKAESARAQAGDPEPEVEDERPEATQEEQVGADEG